MGKGPGKGHPLPWRFFKGMDTPTATRVHCAEHKRTQTIKTDLALRLNPQSPNPLSQNQFPTVRPVERAQGVSATKYPMGDNISRPGKPKVIHPFY
jgi:hypothetical protein